MWYMRLDEERSLCTFVPQGIQHLFRAILAAQSAGVRSVIECQKNAN
jgi:hypothetical protein